MAQRITIAQSHSYHLWLAPDIVRSPAEVAFYTQFVDRHFVLQGRAVVSFFAVELGFAVNPSPAAAAAEFAQLVYGLHAAGIEVIVQVQPFCSSRVLPQTALQSTPSVAILSQEPTRLLE
jgi:hypothetical protein